MIQQQTILNVADNTGAKRIMCASKSWAVLIANSAISVT